MLEIRLEPIAWVHNARRQVVDDNWGDIASEIRLEEAYPEESLDGIEAFSHLEVIFYFHRAREEKVVSGARRPRGNPAFPMVGIFAQRNKDRPNRLGLTVARLVRREGRSLFVEGLDAIDGTPVLDIKPVMAGYLPQGPLRQPEWAHELLKDYWKRSSEGDA